MTGHKAGIITLNLLEASDAYRETQRHKLGEPYRTLVGHFRHELGHYYWDYFFKDPAFQEKALQEFRNLFGDERADYAAALQQHYKEGPLADWNAAHVSAYATSHPWEDWAETWAQYLHIQDGLATARSFGWNSNLVSIPFTPFIPAQIGEQTGEVDLIFKKMLKDWVKLSPAINEIAAGLGFPNLYPFVLSAINARKLDSIHRVIKSATISPPAPVK